METRGEASGKEESTEKAKPTNGSYFKFVETLYTGRKEGETNNPVTHETHSAQKTKPEGLSIDEEKLQKYNNLWYCKKFPWHMRAVAKTELILQELLRIYHPGQPKTRLSVPAKDSTTDTPEFVYIASKAIPNNAKQTNYEDWAALYQGVENGTYKGLGTIAFFAHAYQDIDFKPANIFLDKTTQTLYKIDGDWLAASFRREDHVIGKPFNITSRSLDALPAIMPKTSHAHHWLDQIKSEMEVRDTNEYSTTSLAENFRQEVNEAILLTLLLPNLLIKNFISQYPNIETNEVTFYFNWIAGTIKNAVRAAALTNPSFRDYYQKITKDGSYNAFIIKLTQILENFHTVGKKSLITKDFKLQQTMTFEFLSLQKEMSTKPAAKPMYQLFQGAKSLQQGPSVLGQKRKENNQQQAGKKKK